MHDPTEDPDFQGSSGSYVEPGHEVFAVVTKNQVIGVRGNESDDIGSHE